MEHATMTNEVKPDELTTIRSIWAKIDSMTFEDADRILRYLSDRNASRANSAFLNRLSDQAPAVTRQ